MAPLVFWSRSLKKSRKASKSKSCSLEVAPVDSTFVWRQCTYISTQVVPRYSTCLMEFQHSTLYKEHYFIGVKPFNQKIFLYNCWVFIPCRKEEIHSLEVEKICFLALELEKSLFSNQVWIFYKISQLFVYKIHIWT